MIAVPPEPPVSDQVAVDAVVAVLDGYRLSANGATVVVLGAHVAQGASYLQIGVGEDEELVLQLVPGTRAEHVLAALEACVRAPRPWPHVIRVDAATGSTAGQA